MVRILIHEPPAAREACSVLSAAKGEDIVMCRDRESLIGALSRRRPDVLVYVLKDLLEDLGLLSHLRRLAPMLPIILLGGPIDLASRRAIQEVKPTYYGVLPLEGSELRDAVNGALHRGCVRH